VVIAGVVLALCLSASPAYAQSATLEGEVFETRDGGKVQSFVSCPDGWITLNNITGPAVGPAPGNFVEHLQLTFSPKTGAIEQFDAKFQIVDASGIVISNGSKKLVEGTVTCSFDHLTGLQAFSVKAALSYSAEIQKTIDEGEATVEFVGTSAPKQPVKPFQFTEIFHSSRLTNTPGKVTGGGHHHETTGRSVTFGFNAQNTDDGMKGAGLVIDRNVGVRIKILTVEAFAQDGAWAAFTGKAEVNGVPEDYRIDVDDLAEPGAGSDTFKITTDTYASGGVLIGGNVQIHK
jgi:hypothetical protein